MLALVSAGVMAWRYQPGLDPSRIYYGTDTRAQALLVGAAGAVVAVRRGWWAASADSRAGGGLLAAGAAGLGGIGLLYAVATDSAHWMYRGGFLLVAALTLALVLGAAAPGRSPVARMLSLAPLRWIGIVSYGVYLWHWPVFVAVTPESGLTGPALLAARLALTGLIAALSFLMVEGPVRAWNPTGPGAPWTGRARARALGAAVVVALVSLLATAGPARRGPVSSDTLTASPPAGQQLAGSPIGIYLLGDSVAYGLHSDDPPPARARKSNRWLHKDGVHWTPEAANLVWGWLATSARTARDAR